MDAPLTDSTGAVVTAVPPPPPPPPPPPNGPFHLVLFRVDGLG